MSSPRTASVSSLHLLARIAAAVLGGYGFCWGFIALGMGLMVAAGMPFHDAEHLSAILGLLLFLATFCWAFVARRLFYVWTVLAGGALLMAGGAELVQRAVLSAPGAH